MSLISLTRGQMAPIWLPGPGFAILALFGGRLPLQYFWMPLNILQHVCPMYLGPMESLWAYIEGMDVPHLHYTGANGSNLTAWAVALWPSLEDVCPSSIFGCH